MRILKKIIIINSLSRLIQAMADMENNFTDDTKKLRGWNEFEMEKYKLVQILFYIAINIYQKRKEIIKCNRLTLMN